MPNISYSYNDVRIGDLLLIHEPSNYDVNFYVYLARAERYVEADDWLYCMEEHYFTETLRQTYSGEAVIYYKDVTKNLGNITLDEAKNLMPELFI